MAHFQKIEHKMLVLFFIKINAEIFIARRTERDIVNVHMSSCKVPVVIV